MEKAGRKPKELDIFSDFASFVRDIDWQAVNRKWDQVKGERQADRLDLSPNGVLAEVLILEGAREPAWSWDVGDTPKGRVRTNF